LAQAAVPAAGRPPRTLQGRSARRGERWRLRGRLLPVPFSSRLGRRCDCPWPQLVRRRPRCDCPWARAGVVARRWHRGRLGRLPATRFGLPSAVSPLLAATPVPPPPMPPAPPPWRPRPPCCAAAASALAPTAAPSAGRRRTSLHRQRIRWVRRAATSRPSRRSRSRHTRAVGGDVTSRRKRSRSTALIGHRRSWLPPRPPWSHPRCVRRRARPCTWATEAERCSPRVVAVGAGRTMFSMLLTHFRHRCLSRWGH